MEPKTVCAVCGVACEREARQCKICGFEDELGISPLWVDAGNGNEWLNQAVKPYRKKVFSGPCVSCGKTLPEDARFCGDCGVKAEPRLPTRCTDCEATLPEGAKFCLRCGAKVPIQTVPQHCLNCGTALLGDAVFCMKCGTKRGGQREGQAPGDRGAAGQREKDVPEISVQSLGQQAIPSQIPLNLGADEYAEAQCPGFDYTRGTGKYVYITQTNHRIILSDMNSNYTERVSDVDISLYYGEITGIFLRKKFFVPSAFQLQMKKDGSTGDYAIFGHQNDKENVAFRDIFVGQAMFWIAYYKCLGYGGAFVPVSLQPKERMVIHGFGLTVGNKTDSMFSYVTLTDARIIFTPIQATTQGFERVAEDIEIKLHEISKIARKKMGEDEVMGIAVITHNKPQQIFFFYPVPTMGAAQEKHQTFIDYIRQYLLDEKRQKK